MGRVARYLLSVMDVCPSPDTYRRTEGLYYYTCFVIVVCDISLRRAVWQDMKVLLQDKLQTVHSESHLLCSEITTHRSGYVVKTARRQLQMLQAGETKIWMSSADKQ